MLLYAETPDPASDSAAEASSPTRNVKALFSPGWAGVLVTKAESEGDSDSSAPSSRRVTQNKIPNSDSSAPPSRRVTQAGIPDEPRHRRPADYSDSDRSDSDWDDDNSPGMNPGSSFKGISPLLRKVQVTGSSKPGGSPTAQLAQKHEELATETAAQVENAGPDSNVKQESAKETGIALSPGGSPRNPLAARVAKAAAASIIPPPEHFLSATVDGENLGGASPTAKASTPKSPSTVPTRTFDQKPPNESPKAVPTRTFEQNPADESPKSVPTKLLNPQNPGPIFSTDEPQLVKPSEMRGKAGLSSQRTVEEPKAEALSGGSVLARAEAFQKIVDASADKVSRCPKTRQRCCVRVGIWEEDSREEVTEIRSSETCVPGWRVERDIPSIIKFHPFPLRLPVKHRRFHKG